MNVHSGQELQKVQIKQNVLWFHNNEDSDAAATDHLTHTRRC